MNELEQAITVNNILGDEANNKWILFYGVEDDDEQESAGVILIISNQDTIPQNLLPTTHCNMPIHIMCRVVYLVHCWLGFLAVLELSRDLFNVVKHMISKDPVVQLDMGRKEEQVAHFSPLWAVGNSYDPLLPENLGFRTTELGMKHFSLFAKHTGSRSSNQNYMVVVGLWNPDKCHMCLPLGHVTQINAMANIVDPEIKIGVVDSWNEQDIKAKVAFRALSINKNNMWIISSPFWNAFRVRDAIFFTAATAGGGEERQDFMDG
eukprot:15366774-Ditylum_brightwellii.AAC.1